MAASLFPLPDQVPDVLAATYANAGHVDLLTVAVNDLAARVELLEGTPVPPSPTDVVIPDNVYDQLVAAAVGQAVTLVAPNRLGSIILVRQAAP